MSIHPLIELANDKQVKQAKGFGAVALELKGSELSRLLPPVVHPFATARRSSIKRDIPRILGMLCQKKKVFHLHIRQVSNIFGLCRLFKG